MCSPPQDGRCRSALYLLSSYLPKKSVAPVMKGTLETLSSLDHSSQVTTSCPHLPPPSLSCLSLSFPSPSLLPHSLTHSPPSSPPLQDYTAMLVALLSWKQSSHVIKLISQWLSAGLGGCGQGGGASTEDEAEHQKVKGKVSVLQVHVCVCCTHSHWP